METRPPLSPFPRMKTQLLLLAVGCGVSHALHAGPAALSPPQSVKRAAPLSPSLASSARPSSAPRADALRLKGGSDQVRRAPPPPSTRGGATTMSRTREPKLKPCAACCVCGARCCFPLSSVCSRRSWGRGSCLCPTLSRAGPITPASSPPSLHCR